MVSVVILSKNPSKKLFRDLEAQVFKDFEVIVASEKSIPNAFNNALKKAKGDIFVRIDDDVKLPPHWLENLIAPFKYERVAGVTGPTFVPMQLRQNRDSIMLAENPSWFLKWLYDNGEFNPAGIRKCGCVSYDSNYEERFGFYMNGHEPDHLEGTNWAMRTELIRKVGGFDPKFDGVSEWIDDDVVFKIKKLGYKLSYKPKAYLYHMLEPTSEHFNNRFDGSGRIKNWLRFHIRHSKFHPKMIIYLMIWSLYFIWKSIQRGKK